jgi:DNA-binding cell septation regulator SpoVG
MLKILKVTEINNGALKKSFDAEIKFEVAVRVNDLKLFEKNGRSWVNMPNKKIEKNGEEPYYMALLSPPKEELARIQSLALEALKTPLKQAEAISKELDYTPDLF